MSFFSNLWKGITEPFTGHQARKQARQAFEWQKTNAENQMRLMQENFRKSQAESQRQFDAQLRADASRHRDNMAMQQQAFEANRQAMADQLAQAQQGLAQQASQHAATLAQAQRAQDNANAQLQRQINGAEKDQAHYNKKTDGVAGTILTGPGGVDAEELEKKKKKQTLLGGV